MAEEELIMVSKQSNNIISKIHRLVTNEYGENYWFNGCAKYVMECFGESDFDYEFFAGMTGDVFTQHYTYNGFRGEGVSGYMFTESRSMYLHETEECFELRDGKTGFFEGIFESCGYLSTVVTGDELCKNTEMYMKMLMASIDKGIPVISWGMSGARICVFVGYEEYGKTLLYITGNSNYPVRISLEAALRTEIKRLDTTIGWIFVDKKMDVCLLAELYRERIRTLPKLLCTKTEKYCFGASAFRAWADDIENGKFDNVKPEEFDIWTSYTAYVCALATNGSCCYSFLERAQKLNPDMTFLGEVSRLYRRCGDMWENDNGEDLEAIGGGFNVTLEVLQDKRRRKKIVAKLREFANVTDEIVQVLKQGVEKCCKKI